MEKVAHKAGFIMGAFLALGTLSMAAWKIDTVRLVNENWDQVTVEARIGPNADPGANPSLGSQLLNRGQSWDISSPGQDVWYRRVTPPGDGFWIHQPCYGFGRLYKQSIH
jgi:hypothetical protein